MLTQSNRYAWVENYYSSYQGLSSAVWRRILIHFFESTLVGVCSFLSLYFVNELHLSIASAGILISAYGLGTILGGFVGGRLSDIFSSRIVTILSLILQAVAYFILSKVTAEYLLIIDLFAIGVGSYGFITSNHLCALSYCKNTSERLKAINILSAVSNLGLAIAGLIIGLIATSHFRYIFIFSSLILSMMGIYLLNKVDTILEKNIAASNSTPSYSSSSRVIIFILMSLFIVGLIISQMNSTYPLYLQEIFPDMETKSFSILFSLNAIMVVIFQAPISHYLVNTNKILLAGIGAFLLCGGMLLLNIPYFWMAIISCLITTLGEILFFSVSQLICYENGSHKKKGQSLGTYRMIYALSRMVGPAAGSMLYQYEGAHILWEVCFICGLFCLLYSVFLQKSKILLI